MPSVSRMLIEKIEALPAERIAEVEDSSRAGLALLAVATR